MFFGTLAQQARQFGLYYLLIRSLLLHTAVCAGVWFKSRIKTAERHFLSGYSPASLSQDQSSPSDLPVGPANPRHLQGTCAARRAVLDRRHQGTCPTRPLAPVPRHGESGRPSSSQKLVDSPPGMARSEGLRGVAGAL